MSVDPQTPYEIGRAGEEYLVAYLRDRGHEVEDLGHGATFDLRVDGTLADVKSSRGRPGLLQLTEAQVEAIRAGTEVVIYLVTHLADGPPATRVQVIDGTELLRAGPVVYRTYEWGRTKLDALAEELEGPG